MLPSKKWGRAPKTGRVLTSYTIVGDESRPGAMGSVGIAASVLVFALMATAVIAHPGRTASDGCHYCRTARSGT